MQDDRKMQNSKICYYINDIIMKNLSKLLNIDLKSIRYLDDDLLENFIKEKNDKKLKNVLKNRSEFCIQFTDERGNNIFYEGKKAKSLLKKEEIDLDVNKNVDTIKGQIANSGKVTGRARILKSSSNVKDFKRGNIIVTGMTTPDFAPLIKKSVAIVTDEGGLTCHAAIISRELGKPCIIGTKIATKIIKTGDLIEVDASRGTVRIIK